MKDNDEKEIDKIDGPQVLLSNAQSPVNAYNRSWEIYLKIFPYLLMICLIVSFMENKIFLIIQHLTQLMKALLGH